MTEDDSYKNNMDIVSNITINIKYNFEFRVEMICVNVFIVGGEGKSHVM